jgi:hypothetical protein
MRGNGAATLGDQPGLTARVAGGPEPAPKPKATHQDFPGLRAEPACGPGGRGFESRPPPCDGRAYRRGEGYASV